jgi:hypothetical protein
MYIASGVNTLRVFRNDIFRLQSDAWAPTDKTEANADAQSAPGSLHALFFDVIITKTFPETKKCVIELIINYYAAGIMEHYVSLFRSLKAWQASN